MVITWPKNVPGPGPGAQYVADQATACSDGRLIIQLVASGEVVAAIEPIDSVKAGSVDPAMGQVTAELIARDTLSKKVSTSLNKFRGEQKAYSATTELDFLQARNLDFKWPA